MFPSQGVRSSRESASRCSAWPSPVCPFLFDLCATDRFFPRAWVQKAPWIIRPSPTRQYPPLVTATTGVPALLSFLQRRYESHMGSKPTLGPTNFVLFFDKLGGHAHPFFPFPRVWRFFLSHPPVSSSERQDIYPLFRRIFFPLEWERPACPLFCIISGGQVTHGFVRGSGKTQGCRIPAPCQRVIISFPGDLHLPVPPVPPLTFFTAQGRPF